ncbi:hypothetical protein FISHEDRAFT_41535 [Fistulina hepatica ATCC 64428]|nr:hypothetical protein FISHEDRAFT_41535 [Fistulina hepatica ATCC 64428]
MDLPTSREIELEICLRERDKQVAQLTDEVTRLRRYVAKQPGPSKTEPVTLSPVIASLLLPYLAREPQPSSGSNTVTSALLQRAQLLQAENDELYDLLKKGETGKLKEEVRGLRRVVEKLECALKESHQVVTSLTTELDKAYETLAAQRDHNARPSASQSPGASYQQAHHASIPNGIPPGMNRAPPTGPRAHKKPRLSEPAPSQQQQHRDREPPTHKSLSGGGRQKRRNADDGASAGNRDVRHSPMRERPRSPELERTMRGDRDRAQVRDRENTRGSKRNGASAYSTGSGSPSGRAGLRGTNSPHLSGSGVAGSMNSFNSATDRTLAERLGL